MSKTNFDFLKNVQLVQNKSAVPTKGRAKRTGTPVTPTGMTIRLFKDGKAYPSQELVDKFALEYTPKSSEERGNGLDVIRSDKYPNYPKEAPKTIFIAVTPRSEGRVDLFGSCNYVTPKDIEKDATLVEGNPVSSVTEQGSPTFGRDELIPMLKDIYGFEFEEGQRFVDLEIGTDVQLTTEDGIYYFPKMVSRGADKGKSTLVRRENTPLMPLGIVDRGTTQETAETSVETESHDDNYMRADEEVKDEFEV